ncbi:hypothetical protein HIM_06889 [Hirsutella minnesotensis 3608]|uniref:G domain-containing protein n=1 Tax=Hirsutella minnesotensis 3608 TaxID=1043627 RepID=A0A0F7ZIJ5_9HYPO|nr:hypothetical protein HIM_06889 [Hirsutella minnesotensis 3608]
MLPSRRPLIRELPKSILLVVRPAISRPFSTSSPANARKRPGRLRRSLPQVPCPEKFTAKEQMIHGSREESTARAVSDRTWTPSIRGGHGPRKQQHDPVRQADIGQRAATNKPGSEDTALSFSVAQEAAPSPSALKDSLLSYHSISQRPGGRLETEPVLAHDKGLAAAHAFFTDGGNFLYSAATLRDHPRNDHVPEIAVMGASNAGKSTFLNALMGKPDVARTGQRPGLTQLMNVYGRTALRGAVVLLSMDKKKGALGHDLWLLRALARSETPTLVVLTKADRCGADWPLRSESTADAVNRDLMALDDEFGGRWRVHSGPTTCVHVTAAGIDKVGGLRSLGNAAGIGGVRRAMLQVAGFSVSGKGVEKAAEHQAYSGPIVPFEELQWK